MTDHVDDLLRFIDQSPTPYHAVSEAASRLEASGYVLLDEGEAWSLSPGDRCYVVRAGGSLAAFEVGSQLTVEHFEKGSYVDVSGETIGKGFAGGMKRWGFKGGRASHGAHRTHRSPGSIGQCQDPGRVFKNKKMSGHMGVDNKTVQNVQIAAVDNERNWLLVKGSVPGSKGGVVFVNDAIKKTKG